MDGKKFSWPKRPNLTSLYSEIIKEDEQLPEEQERRRRFWEELTSEEWLAEWAKTREDIRFRIAMTGMEGGK